jgi:hypothetical protein
VNNYIFWQENGHTIYEHQRVWERAHGPIPDGMQIHHINLDRSDNRLDNLILVAEAEHQRLHFPQNWRRNDNGEWERRCLHCGAWGTFELFGPCGKYWRTLCHDCARRDTLERSRRNKTKYNAQRQLAYPMHQDRQKEYSRQYYYAHKEQAHQYYLAHKKVRP